MVELNSRASAINLQPSDWIEFAFCTNINKKQVNEEVHFLLCVFKHDKSNEVITVFTLINSAIAGALPSVTYLFTV